MIYLPAKPELTRFARGRDVERLGYAHTLAHHFAALGNYWYDHAFEHTRPGSVQRAYCEEKGHQAYRRYDRCTRFLYEQTAV